MNRALAIGLFALTIGAAADSSRVAAQTRTVSDAEFDAELESLSSKDETTRRAAIARFIDQGHAVVPRLIESFRRIPTAIPCTLDPASDLADRQGLVPCLSEAGDEILRLNLRKKTDIILILGTLRAVEAVPSLIDSLERQGDDISPFQTGRMRPEMWALVQIGSPAVPLLVQMLYQATSEAPVSCGATAVNAKFIITDILGEIGDAKALPLLADLQGRVDSEVFRNCVDKAIENILAKTGSH
ncbi:MAG: hypothetical protein ACREDR_32610 [Blastocatellia bacterium]